MFVTLKMVYLPLVFYITEILHVLNSYQGNGLSDFCQLYYPPTQDAHCYVALLCISSNHLFLPCIYIYLVFNSFIVLCYLLARGTLQLKGFCIVFYNVCDCIKEPKVRVYLLSWLLSFVNTTPP